MAPLVRLFEASGVQVLGHPGIGSDEEEDDGGSSAAASALQALQRLPSLASLQLEDCGGLPGRQLDAASLQALGRLTQLLSLNIGAEYSFCRGGMLISSFKMPGAALASCDLAPARSGPWEDNQPAPPEPGPILQLHDYTVEGEGMAALLRALLPPGIALHRLSIMSCQGMDAHCLLGCEGVLSSLEDSELIN
ncbi:hypothetical protein ABPG75_012024 [Micractinium tetrahymenae]